ncbi:TPA: phage tail tape measure protein [Candidatus Scatenecus faecavium]|uniref:Phage tail tape measure protein n=1 Tax=Candidatus Scatenecus faecavium TaxID=2840915 RepID=A0A9D1FXF9_9BACT|nr:phage tail tape measure protein [Candidatus Scatenecus faecavium]
MMKVSLTLVAFDRMSRVIRDAVNKSNSEFDKLQNRIKDTSEMLDTLGKNMAKLGGALTVAGGGLAHKLGITEAIPEAFQMEHRLRELGNVGQLSAKQLEDMDKRLASISRYTNQMRPEIAEGLNVLVASGIDPTKALDYMNVIGRTATGEQAVIEDISRTAFSVTDNLKVPVSELGKAMDILAMSGKEGRFELKDMASAFPSLTAGASMLGMKGTPAVASLGAALQVAMKGAGEASEAANNLENFIQKVTAPLSVKNFKETFGVDLKQVLLDTAAAGRDPILEVIELMTRLSGGDVFKVSEVFQDKQVLNFIKPMMQNLDEYKRIKASALSAEGVVNSDFEHMMKTTTEQFKAFKINMKELVFPHLQEPLKKINELLTKINDNPILQKGLFGAIMGTIGAGILLTVLGTATILIGKFVGMYGKFLSHARNLTPILVQNSIKLLEFLGLNTTAHNLTYGRKIIQAGNPLGLDMSTFSLKNSLFADIRRIDKNMHSGIINGFKELPGNISKSAVALKDWITVSIKAIPGNFIGGLKAFKTGFLGIPNMIKNAIIAFRAFSVTLLTSPLGWIALAIGAVALVIYKYWKPISGFFKGVWQGLKEGLQPLMPLFNRIGKAMSPIIAPIKAIADWFKKLVKPVEDTGGAAEKMGVRFGKAITNIIVKFVELATKAFEFGHKITSMLAEGIMSGLAKVKGCISKVAQVIRDHLPHSPAKTGPLKDLHKVKIVETIASTIKPLPLMTAMNKSLGFFSGGLKTQVARAGKTTSPPIVITYNPTITISGSESKEEFLKMLKKHKDEVVNIIKREFERKERVAY